MASELRCGWEALVEWECYQPRPSIAKTDGAHKKIVWSWCSCRQIEVGKHTTTTIINNWSKLNKILFSFTTIQQRQLVRLRNRVFRLWLCIIWNHQRPTTCKISYNSEIIFLTVKSDISPRPNKPDSPNRSVCATSTRLRTNFNHIIFFMLWLFRMWDNTLRTLSGRWS